MPELPEVETVRTVLAPFVVGQAITRVTVNLPKVVANLDPTAFGKKLTGQTITDFTRRGKYLTFHLASGDYVVVHFRMTGTLTVESPDTAYEKHTNLVLGLANGRELRYIDSRGFGHWWFFAKDTPDTSGQANLGPEPPDVTFGYLQQTIGTRRLALKTLLLDQHIVAGIGNIYADEICHRIGVRPTRPGNTLTDAELTKLAATIPAVIAEFIQFHHVPFDKLSPDCRLANLNALNYARCGNGSDCGVVAGVGYGRGAFALVVDYLERVVFACLYGNRCHLKAISVHIFYNGYRAGKRFAFAFDCCRNLGGSCAYGMDKSVCNGGNFLVVRIPSYRLGRRRNGKLPVLFHVQRDVGFAEFVGAGIVTCYQCKQQHCNK